MPPTQPAKTPRIRRTPEPTPDEARQAIERIRERREQSGGQVRGSVTLRGTGGSGVGNRIVSIYLNTVYNKIMNNWTSPPGLSGDNEVSVVIHIKIDSSGRITYRNVIKSSGIPAVDQQALRAVDKANPLNSPPELIKNVVAQDGINLRFFPSGR